MMKKQITVALASALFAMTALGSGCKQISTGGMADAATKDLGIPVFLWALDGDVCASRQLKVLFDEFGSHNGAGRAALATQFKDTYKAIVVLATKDLGDTTGTLKVVRLLDSRNYVVDTKTIVDTRANDSHQRPGTVVDKGEVTNIEGKVLSLRPNSSTDKSVKSLYSTTSSAVFGKLGASEVSPSLSLEDAITQGSVSTVQQGFADADLCGKFATVADLF